MFFVFVIFKSFAIKVIAGNFSHKYSIIVC